MYEAEGRPRTVTVLGVPSGLIQTAVNVLVLSRDQIVVSEKPPAI